VLLYLSKSRATFSGNLIGGVISWQQQVDGRIGLQLQ